MNIYLQNILVFRDRMVRNKRCVQSVNKKEPYHHPPSHVRNIVILLLVLQALPTKRADKTALQYRTRCMGRQSLHLSRKRLTCTRAQRFACVLYPTSSSAGDWTKSVPLPTDINKERPPVNKKRLLLEFVAYSDIPCGSKRLTGRSG